MAGPPAASRFQAPFFVGLQGSRKPWGVASNVSTTGILLETRDLQPVGSEHTIFIVWDIDSYRCHVRVARHAERGLAIEYVEPDAAFMTAIEEIVADAPPARVSCPDYQHRFEGQRRD